MRREKTGKNGARIFAFLIVIVFVGVLYIWNSLVVDKRANEVVRLEKKLEQLKMERLLLESRYERLVSVSYIVPFARKELGLVFPKENPKEIEIRKDEF